MEPNSATERPAQDAGPPGGGTPKDKEAAAANGNGNGEAGKSGGENTPQEAEKAGPSKTAI